MRGIGRIVEGQRNNYGLKKLYRVTGLFDFDFAKMCEQDQKALLKKIQDDLELSEYYKFDQGVIIVVLRGGEKNRWPIYGLFRLRNFRQVLQFLAESLKEQPGYETEYNVAPSELTEEFLKKVDECDKGKVKFGGLDNPRRTLQISSQARTVLIPLPPMPDRLVDTDYNGEVFWVSSPQKQTEAKIEGWENRYPPRWNKQVFDMLYEIFQFNRVEPPVSAPSLTLPASK